MSAQVRWEATESGFCGYELTAGGVLLIIWDTADDSPFVQVLGTKFFVLQRRLAGVGTEPTAGVGKVETNGDVLGR